MRIVTWDTETRGLFGELFIIGLFDGENISFFTGVDEFIEALKRFGEVYAFAHNLDFDIGKLWKATEEGIDLDWKTMVVNHHNLLRVKLRGCDVWFCDSMRIFPGSLEKLSKDFELKTPKIDLEDYISQKGYMNKEEFFEKVSPDDELLRIYLEADCRALFELLQKGIEFSSLSVEEFVKCPTLPALSMKIYQKQFTREYKMVTKVKMSRDLEEFSRKAYIGARVEVVKPVLEHGGYHYDVNSLYPYVMMTNSFPVGQYNYYKGNMAHFAYEVFKKGGFRHCLVKAKVYVPEDMYIPPLPCRDDKLIFPVGRFKGYFVGEELAMAEEYGVVAKVEEGYFWKQGEYIFKGFVKRMMKEKMESKGARRNFFKMVQNSLYGKFGMRREREVYVDIDEEEKLSEKGTPYLKVMLTCGKEIIVTQKTVYASYVRPYIAAYVTAYARMFLYRAIVKVQKHIYYYDTDSMVLDVTLPEREIDDKEYGKWKLEREIGEAMFLQPKLYAEKSKDGNEVLKSKGLVKDYRKKMTYEVYREIMQAIREGKKEFELYRDIPARRKFITALKQGKDVDEAVLLRKKINLLAKQKRKMDYVNNSSKPLKVYYW